MAGATVMTGSIGPVCAVVVDVVHPGLRATAAACLSLMQNLFGLAAGPLITGYLSDAYGLQFALSVVPLFCLLAAALFVVAARIRDTISGRSGPSRPSRTTHSSPRQRER